jgi:glucose/arabinose dehydrogenase
MLNGQNFVTNNIFTNNDEDVLTGAFSPFGVPNMPYEVRKGLTKAAGSILRANQDGTGLELVAWGFRYPVYLKYDRLNRLFVSNQTYEIRGSRPIANAPDEFHIVTPGIWYGWPDYSAGEPVTSSKFKPEGGVQPEFLLTNHPNLPPYPYATFPPFSYVAGFDFNYNSEFGPYGDAYIAEFGGGGRIVPGVLTPYIGIGHRISKIDMNTGEVTTFAMNKSGFPSFVTGGGGLSRPADVEFGPDGALYVLDLGTNYLEDLSSYQPNTGVIWKITRT